MLKRRQIQFTERQIKAIRREGARRGVSDSAVVRAAVDTALSTGSDRAPGARALLQALRELGLTRSRRPRKVSIAVEHDKYAFVDPRD